MPSNYLYGTPIHDDNLRLPELFIDTHFNMVFAFLLLSLGSAAARHQLAVFTGIHFDEEQNLIRAFNSGVEGVPVYTLVSRFPEGRFNSFQSFEFVQVEGPSDPISTAINRRLAASICFDGPIEFQINPETSEALISAHKCTDLDPINTHYFVSIVRFNGGMKLVLRPAIPQ
jgi:hypothetical protein